MLRKLAFVSWAVALLGAAPIVILDAATPGSTVARIKSTGRITFGYRGDARPFSYTDDSGAPAGYSVVLCQQIANEAKRDLGMPELKVEWKPVAFEQRFRSLRLGEIDLMCGADTVTLGRRSEADFSIPIFPGGISALLRSDSSARLRDVLSGRGQPFHPVWRASATQVLQSRDFSAVAGTTAETWLGQRLNDLDVRAGVALVDTYSGGVQRVVQRRSDVLFGERAILLDLAKRHGDARDLVVLDRLFTNEPAALALAADNNDFRLLVDRALSRLYRSPDLGVLYAKYFGEPDETALTFFRWNALPE
ncbi:MAG TPA: amino acid ABC transporter substrate-binding protein [Vicinamibacterales bacterium]|jgi:ABC-type amino acid transport substrate-binding protein|nr:amino acid ABC transporter substrate-binding protein [Vicinamibacterales bacterium]